MFSNYQSLSFNYGVIVQALEESVKRNLTDGMLLSGGAGHHAAGLSGGKVG
jgi:hypothetical protein